jgi:signal transduction histidine kinase
VDQESYNILKHELRQPLNAISLAAANLRFRIEPHLDEAEASYARDKFEKIDEEIQRLAKMLNAFPPD